MRGLISTIYHTELALDNMSIRILIDPPKDVRPEGAIRADVAWKLFMPDTMGDVPEEWRNNSEWFKRWLWNALSRKLGFLHPQSTEVYILTPELTPAAREFIVRTCSFWTNQVYVVERVNGVMDLEQTGENLWIAPIVNAFNVPDDSAILNKIAGTHDGVFHSLLSPLLGSGRTNIRTYSLAQGRTFARFHSHTSREELYLVLGGKGSIRIADHTIEIKEGDLVAKPTGPDIPTQLLADRGTELKILDIEVWPDPEKNSKDVVHYPDHRELDLFGEGWDIMIPSDSIMGVEDSMHNYDTGYERHLDGSWTPKEFPATRRRKK